MDSLTGPVPDHWSRTFLGEICDIQVGSPQVDRAARSRADRRLPVISARNIAGDRLTVEGPVPSLADVPPNLRGYRAVTGDLVCARTGRPVRAALVDSDHHDWLIGSSCIRLRARSGLRSRFLLQYLRHPGVADWLDRTAMSSVIPTHRLSGLRAMPIVLPPEAEQDAIVDALALLDDKITVHREIVRVGTELRDRSLLLLMAGALHGRGADETSAGDA